MASRYVDKITVPNAASASLTNFFSIFVLEITTEEITLVERLEGANYCSDFGYQPLWRVIILIRCKIS